MFGKKRKKNSIEVTKLSSLIADNLEIIGDVKFTGGLRIDGRVEGNVLGQSGQKSLIVLSRKGSITGRVHAYDAVVNGHISGDLVVDHFLELQADARISGNISYGRLQMESGATVDGKLMKMDEPQPVLPKAAGRLGHNYVPDPLLTTQGKASPLGNTVPPAEMPAKPGSDNAVAKALTTPSKLPKEAASGKAGT